MKKLFTLLTIIAMGVASVFAQSKKVSGIVVDTEGEPVIGASVEVTGTNTGTITDYDGNFEITVPESATTLTFSFVGMQKKEVKIQSYMRVVLEESAEHLDEIVATGHLNVAKNAFNGSAQTVDSKTIEQKSPTEISKALAGEVAGVQVINSSGQPGSNASIQIRGIGSINSNSSPLYVVDGISYDGDISAIDPGDIETTTILKDATATALYGARGANGVVVITTKKGTSGDEGKIEVDLKYGANMRLLPLHDFIKTPEEYLTLAWLGMYNTTSTSKSSSTRVSETNAGLFGSTGIPEAYKIWDLPTNLLINPYDAQGNIAPTFASDAQRLAGYKNLESWEDEMFRVGQKAEASVKISGGTDKTNYYVSLGYLKDEGYYQESDFQRFNVRSNISFQPKKWLKGNVRASFAYGSTNSPGQSSSAANNGFQFINTIPAIYPVYERTADGSAIATDENGNKIYDYGDATNRSYSWGINPAGAIHLDKLRGTFAQTDVKGELEFKIIDGLKFKVIAGLLHYYGSNVQVTNRLYGDAAGIGRVYRTTSSFLMFEAREQLEFNKTFGAHSVSAMLAHESIYDYSEAQLGYKYGMIRDDTEELAGALKMDEVSSSHSSDMQEGILANANYIYDERYMFTANYRADGSSTFAKGHRWGHFGSVGIGWNFTNERFMEPIKDWLHHGKLRLSWGMLGNQDMGSLLYAHMFGVGYFPGGYAMYVEGRKGNSDLTWEHTSTTDLGLEFDISKYLTAEIDYYYKKTDNLLFTRYVAPSLGYGGYYTNDAKMMNTGVEFQFKVHAVNRNNVKLDIRLNGGHYKNKMLEMPVDYYDENGKAVRMIMSGNMSVGHSTLDYYMKEYAGVNEDGEAIWYAAYDANKGDFMANLGNNERNYILSQYEYEQQNKDKDIDIRDTVVTNYNYAVTRYVGKSAMPALDGGFGFDLEVYGVTLSATLSYRLGGYGYDNTYALLMSNSQAGEYNWHRDMLKSWTETNTNTDIPKLTNGTGTYASYYNNASTRFLTSNSFLSLNNIRIGYNLPKKVIDKMKMKAFNIWISADNLAIASARKGYNPMVSLSGGSSVSQYTPLSTVLGGIKFTF